MHRPTAPGSRRRHRWATAVTAVVGFGLLAGCGGQLTPSAGGRAGPGGPTPPARDTPIPRVSSSTTTSSPPTRRPTPKKSTRTHKPTKKKRPKRRPQPHVHSDVVGRHFDLGVIVGTDDVKGVRVIVLDRWTARGVPDPKIAANGYPLAPHSGHPFYNINPVSTYRIPVARGATFTYQHCTDIAKPMRTRHSSLRAMTHLSKAEQVVLVTLDKQGRATAVKNDPVC